jgi:hypothetical protein
MFILGKCSGREEVNTEIGNWYRVVSAKQNPLEFKTISSKLQCNGKVNRIILGETQSVELSVDDKAYIMTDNGKTFDNLSRF